MANRRSPSRPSLEVANDCYRKHLATRSGVQVEAKCKTIAMFCGVGLTVSLLRASYGVDLSSGFF